MKTLEHLYHFNCSKCNKWWSIGDAATNPDLEWYCPWCGFKEKHDLVS